jgi:hypothetical protein
LEKSRLSGWSGGRSTFSWSSGSITSSDSSTSFYGCSFSSFPGYLSLFLGPNFSFEGSGTIMFAGIGKLSKLALILVFLPWIVTFGGRSSSSNIIVPVVVFDWVDFVPAHDPFDTIVLIGMVRQVFVHHSLESGMTIDLVTSLEVMNSSFLVYILLSWSGHRNCINRGSSIGWSSCWCSFCSRGCRSGWGCGCCSWWICLNS